MTDTIKNFPNRLHRMTQVFYREVPSQVAARRFVDSLVNLLFPVRDRRGMSLKEMDLRWENLQQDFLHIITPLCSGMDCCCERLTARFFAEIPLIYAGLMKDANLYKSCDPAAYCDRGSDPVLSGLLRRYGIPALACVATGWTFRCCRASYRNMPTAKPASTFTRAPRSVRDSTSTTERGIVIGETTVIGRNVKLYQGVTLGARFVEKELTGVKRHPTIEDNVIIYAGSTILGGDTVVGHDTVIGGNVWLTESVPPHSTVYHKPEIIIKGK